MYARAMYMYALYVPSWARDERGTTYIQVPYIGEGALVSACALRDENAVRKDGRTCVLFPAGDRDGCRIYDFAILKRRLNGERVSLELHECGSMPAFCWCGVHANEMWSASCLGREERR